MKISVLQIDSFRPFVILKKMNKIPALALAALLAGPVPQALSAELIQMGHLEALGTYTEIKNGERDRGVDASGFYSPIVALNPTLVLIPLYDFHYNAYPQYLPQDEGNAFYNTYLVNNLHVALRKEFQPGWFLKFTGLGTWNLMKETPDDKWTKGLYDYYDVGGNIELRRIVRPDEMTEQSSSLAFQYYRRTYPNFQTLVSSTTVTPPEVNEKDYDGLRLTARFETNVPGVSRWYAEPYVEDKLYIDKHLVNEDGTLSPDKMRVDLEAGLNVGAVYVPQKLSRFSFSVDGNYSFNNSNMDYYDSRNSISLSDDVFTPDYYNYNSFDLQPSLEYAHPFGEGKAIRLRVGYSALYRLYASRKALSIAGDYTDHEQRDWEQSYFAAVNIPFTKTFSWITNYSYTHVTSNQKFEDYYRYNYDSYQIKSGVSLDF
jgi:hypothetical protein